MKLLVVIALCVALAVAMPRDERFLKVHMPTKHQMVQELKHIVASGATTAACTVACDAAFPEAMFLCGSACAEVVHLVG